MAAANELSPCSPTDPSAKESLLDHAEDLFATRGYDGVSLRDLTRQAGTHLASVNYHFGSKEKLFEEVVLRRIRPLNQHRLRALAQVLTDAGTHPPALANVLEAFARPFVVGPGATHRESLRRMVCRMFMDADPLITPIFHRELVPIVREFRAAAALACPQLTQRQVDSGMVFYAGAMINLLATEKRLALLPSSEPLPSDEEMLQHLLRFGVAGFAALAALAADSHSPPPAASPASAGTSSDFSTPPNPDPGT